MELLLKRTLSNQHETIGELYINRALECNTLEDEYRAVKVMKETRIPAGRYQIKFRRVGGHHLRYSQRFPGIHKGMLELQNVPNFKFILIHIGNFDKDTDGCILVGKGHQKQGNGRYMLLKSVGAYLDFYNKVAAALLRGEDVFIKIEDHDR